MSQWRVSILVMAWLVGLGCCQEEPEIKPFQPPSRPEGDVYIAESFSDGEGVWSRWVKSEAMKDGADSDIAKYDGVWKLQAMKTEGAIEEDIGLVLTEKAKHYAVSSKLERPFSFEGTESLVVQYEVNFQDGLSCGGAYIKLLSAEDLELTEFGDKTPYSIMFGPDKCGLSSKVHFIVRFKNPVTGEVEEKHSKQAEGKMDFFDDKKTHLFTLIIYSDNTYHITVDQMPFLKGNLLTDLTPAINPLKEIDDPNDKMPEDWDEREQIPDPEATKPDDWDEDAPQKIPDPDASKPDGWLDDGPEFIPDPDATPPEDWDEEEDGEWEAPMISNPACDKFGCGDWSPPMIQNPNYKGKWKAPLIDNPDYDGKWAPRKINNPAFFEDETPYFSFTPIAAVGFELWSMSENIYFDNILVTSELTIANSYARDGWVLKMERERHLGGAFAIAPWLDTFVELANTYPYLWALYAIAIVLPFALCAACCVRSKPSPKDEAAKKKKTDEPTPDDPPKEETPAEPQDEKSFVAEADDQEEDGRNSQAEEAGSQEESHGEESQGEGTQEEGSQGEGTQGEGSQGEGTQGEGSQGEGSQEEETTAAPAQEEDTKPRQRKRKPRRED